MTPAECNALVITPALKMLPVKMDTPAARRMLLAIGLQESELRYRRQIPTGPAKGLWQFERGGGVAGVLAHPQSALYAQTICEAREIPAEVATVYHSLECDDVLAAAFARLLLWTDPDRLPDDMMQGYYCYSRTWRPGAKRPDDWPDNWRLASEALELAS